MYRFRRFLRPRMFLLAGLILTAAFVTGYARAGVDIKPLVIIRFNQPTVYYARPLYNAVSRAVEVRPDVRFDILALSPLAPSSGVTRSLAEDTKQHAHEVLQTMEKMGIPRARLAYTLQQSSAVESSEVHIFVR